MGKQSTSNTLHITDYDNLHIYLLAQILDIPEEIALELYNDYFEEHEDEYEGCEVY